MLKLKSVVCGSKQMLRHKFFAGLWVIVWEMTITVSLPSWFSVVIEDLGFGETTKIKIATNIYRKREGEIKLEPFEEGQKGSRAPEHFSSTSDLML